MKPTEGPYRVMTQGSQSVSTRAIVTQQTKERQHPITLARMVSGTKADARLLAKSWEMREALRKLEAWSRCFIEDTPISAETLWAEFPIAVNEARALLASIDGDSQ